MRLILEISIVKVVAAAQTLLRLILLQWRPRCGHDSVSFFVLVAAARTRLHLIVIVMVAARTRLGLIINIVEAPLTRMRLIVPVMAVTRNLSRLIVLALATV